MAFTAAVQLCLKMPTNSLIREFSNGSLGIFDVEIRDLDCYQDFMNQVKPALAAAGAKYLARGGEHRLYEGDWTPRRIMILEFPSIESWEGFL